MKRSDQSEMGKSKVAILLLGALFASCIRLDLKVEARRSSPSEIGIDAKLKLLNKPAVKTIKSEDGDIIDCVDIYKQPAFDHPALKNHTIQMVPNFLLESKSSSPKNASNSRSIVFQTWQRSGSCPRGTIPVRRIQKEDLMRATSLKRFGMKPPEPLKNSTNNHSLHFPNLNITTNNDVLTRNPADRSAAYLVTMGYNYIGSEADINVWNPSPNVELSNDFTTAQIWLKAGNGPDYFESVESGWMVNPKLYGDHATRLFAYWTRDSYESTGCFDLTCPGFVHTNTQVSLGAAIQPVSSQSGPQYDINVGMFLDPKTGNWWLKIRNNIPVGYWPSEILGNLRHSAILVEWGGQVFSSGVKKHPHTGTGMGSGQFATGLFGHACFMRNIRIEDYSLSLKYPQFVYAFSDEPYCYSAKNFQKGYGEPVFYFGGPGRNPPFCS